MHFKCPESDFQSPFCGSTRLGLLVYRSVRGNLLHLATIKPKGLGFDPKSPSISPLHPGGFVSISGSADVGPPGARRAKASDKEQEFTFEEKEEEEEMPTCNGRLTQTKTQLKEIFRSESVSQSCKDLVNASGKFISIASSDNSRIEA